jgi:ABC-type antimicrobial peptide transport system permease subunit
LSETVRRTVAGIDPALPIIGMATLEQQIERSLGRDRLISVLSALFGVLALILTCTGVYGVLAYGVTRRRREVGIRMALGAQAGEVRWMVGRRGIAMLASGLLLGLPLALGAGRLARGLLYGVSASDATALALATLVLLATTAAASYLPMRKALQIDPVTALRVE